MVHLLALAALQHHCLVLVQERELALPAAAQRLADAHHLRPVQVVAPAAVAHVVLRGLAELEDQVARFLVRALLRGARLHSDVLARRARGHAHLEVLVLLHHLVPMARLARVLHDLALPAAVPAHLLDLLRHEPHLDHLDRDTAALAVRALGHFAVL